MKAYRLWITLLAGLIVVLFMFGRLVRGADLSFSKFTTNRASVLVNTGSGNWFWKEELVHTETNYFQTNVTAGDNASGCPMFSRLVGNNHLVLNHDCRPHVPATERWWTTNIVQVSRLKLIWRGEPEEITRTKTVTNVTVRSKLKQEWSEPEEDKVTDFRAGPVFFATNRMSGIQVKPAGTNWVNYDLLVPTNGITWSTNWVYSNLWIAGHMVKIITNANGTFTIEGLPEKRKE